MDAIHDALIMNTATGQTVPLLRRPAEYLGPLTGSVLFATGDLSSRWIHVVRNLIGTVYRFDFDGTLLDSLAVPTEFFTTTRTPLAVPGNGNPEAIRDWVMDRAWLTGLRSINDSILLIERRSWPSSSALKRPEFDRPDLTHLLIYWGAEPRVVALTDCSCRFLGAIGDIVVFQRGEAPDPIAFETRLMHRLSNAFSDPGRN